MAGKSKIMVWIGSRPVSLLPREFFDCELWLNRMGGGSCSYKGAKEDRFTSTSPFTPILIHLGQQIPHDINTSKKALSPNIVLRMEFVIHVFWGTHSGHSTLKMRWSGEKRGMF